MKLIAELNHEKHEVILKQHGDNLSADIDGRHYELEAHEIEPNVYLLKHEGKIYQVFVSPRHDLKSPFAVDLGNHHFEIKIADPKRLRGSAGLDADADGIFEIKTQMPGKVVRILVKQGSEVTAGDSVLVVEAMKMQNEMKSPKDGIVKEIRVEEGATVNAGDVLAVIE